jgi:hypothetical protein
MPDPVTTTTTTLAATDVLTQQAKEVGKQVLPVMADMAQQMLDWLREGKDFMVGQAPDLARQIIAWGFAQALTGAVLETCLLVLCLWIMKRCWPIFIEGISQKPTDPIVVRVMAAGGVGVVALLIILSGVPILWEDIMTTVKVGVAPKVYLIEYLSTLVKK